MDGTRFGPTYSQSGLVRYNAVTSRIDSLKQELDALVHQGQMLPFAMLDSLGIVSEKAKADLAESGAKLPSFKEEYETWYSEALRVIKQVIPDRVEDFVKLYRNEKRKEINLATYTIADFLMGVEVSRFGQVVVGKADAFPKMQIQVSILESAAKRFESSLFDLRDVLQADLFDSELEAARELAKKGFFRAGGALAGVALEKHLGQVCQGHGLKSRKANPSIADFDQLLKDASVLDTSSWRFIQHLADIRNLCDHGKDREPTREDVLELVEGVGKVLKTVF